MRASSAAFTCTASVPSAVAVVMRCATKSSSAPAGSGLAHHGEGGIFVGFELLEGVSNEKKFHEVTLGGSKSMASDFDLGAEFHHAIGGQVEEVGGG